MLDIKRSRGDVIVLEKNKIIKKAEESLLSGNAEPVPSLLRGLLRQFTSLRVASLMIFLLLIAILILSSQNSLSSLRATKKSIWEEIQIFHSQILGTASPAFSNMPLDKDPNPDIQEKAAKDSKEILEEKAE